MTCPSCGHENREAARFCLSCGGELALSCPRCSAQLPPGARFCDACGQRVGEAPRACPRARPRDYTPSTSRTRSSTPSPRWRASASRSPCCSPTSRDRWSSPARSTPRRGTGILERFFEILTDGVHRFEGTVNQYTGDGIMALFGAPIAHEDHAQRACYAALHLRDALRSLSARDANVEHGVDFSVRIGMQLGRGRRRQDRRRPAHGLHRPGPHRGPRQAHGVAGGAGRLLPHGRDGRARRRLLRAGRSRRRSGSRDVSEPVPVHELEGRGAAQHALRRGAGARAHALRRARGRHADPRGRPGAGGTRRGQPGGGRGGRGRRRQEPPLLRVPRALPRQGHRRSSKGTPWPTARTCPSCRCSQVFRAYYGIAQQDDDRTAREKIAGRLLLLDECVPRAPAAALRLLRGPRSERPAPPLTPEARQRQLFGVLRKVIQEGDPDGLT